MLHAVPLHKIEPFYYSLVNRTAVELTWDYNFSLSIRTHRVTILDLDKLKMMLAQTQGHYRRL